MTRTKRWSRRAARSLEGGERGKVSSISWSALRMSDHLVIDSVELTTPWRWERLKRELGEGVNGG